jgi:molybdopterin-containing oxidoreductase family iron-sulfur binding subunit
LHEDVRSYALLEELNVKPRNLYLARVRNPHPAFKVKLVESSHSDHEDHAGEGQGHEHDHNHDHAGEKAKS